MERRVSEVWAAHRMLFSRKECTRLLNLSQTSVDRLLRSGKLGSVKKGSRRLITRQQLLDFAGEDIRERLAV